MTDKQEVATQPADERERMEREPALVMVPPTDVFEDPEGITLQLDMPGVSKDRLTMEATMNALLIEGTVRIDTPQGMAAL